MQLTPELEHRVNSLSERTSELNQRYNDHRGGRIFVLPSIEGLQIQAEYAKQIGTMAHLLLDITIAKFKGDV